MGGGKSDDLLASPVTLSDPYQKINANTSLPRILIIILRRALCVVIIIIISKIFFFFFTKTKYSIFGIREIFSNW